MSVGVVDGLEMVQVDQKTGDIRTMSRGEQKVPAQDLVEVAVVVETGQAVAEGLFLQRLVHSLQFLGITDQVGLGFSPLFHLFHDLFVDRPAVFYRLGQAGHVLDGEHGVEIVSFRGGDSGHHGVLVAEFSLRQGSRYDVLVQLG